MDRSLPARAGRREAVIASQLGCARAGCCQRAPLAGEGDVQADVERVALEALMEHIGPGGLGIPTTGAAGERFFAMARVVKEAAANGALLSVRMFWLPVEALDSVPTERYRLTEDTGADAAMFVLEVVMCGGLCVVSGSSGTWILPSLRIPPIRLTEGLTSTAESVKAGPA